MSSGFPWDGTVDMDDDVKPSDRSNNMVIGDVNFDEVDVSL